MTLYNLRSPDTITKFDNSGNVEASYSTSREACTCPAGQRPTCRHRQMLPYLLPICNSEWFLDWDVGRVVVNFQGIPKDLARAAPSPAPEGRFQPEAPAASQTNESVRNSQCESDPAKAVRLEAVTLQTSYEVPADSAKSWRRL